MPATGGYLMGPMGGPMVTQGAFVMAGPPLIPAVAMAPTEVDPTIYGKSVPDQGYTHLCHTHTRASRDNTRCRPPQARACAIRQVVGGVGKPACLRPLHGLIIWLIVCWSRAKTGPTQVPDKAPNSMYDQSAAGAEQSEWSTGIFDCCNHDKIHCAEGIFFQGSLPTGLYEGKGDTRRRRGRALRSRVEKPCTRAILSRCHRAAGRCLQQGARSGADHASFSTFHIGSRAHLAACS
jgi:hypothetical protein